MDFHKCPHTIHSIIIRIAGHKAQVVALATVPGPMVVRPGEEYVLLEDVDANG